MQTPMPNLELESGWADSTTEKPAITSKLRLRSLIELDLDTCNIFTIFLIFTIKYSSLQLNVLNSYFHVDAIHFKYTPNITYGMFIYVYVNEIIIL
jgi:hypothetical protein